jgi:hypothetical protein
MKELDERLRPATLVAAAEAWLWDAFVDSQLRSSCSHRSRGVLLRPFPSSPACGISARSLQTSRRLGRSALSSVDLAEDERERLDLVLFTAITGGRSTDISSAERAVRRMRRS